MKKQYFVFTLFFFTLQTPASSSFDANKVFSFRLSDSLIHYLKIQKDLANDDFSVVRETATTWRDSLKKGLPPAPENKIINDLVITLENFSKTENQSQLRIQFGKISQIVIGYLKVHPTENKNYQLFSVRCFLRAMPFGFSQKKEG